MNDLDGFVERARQQRDAYPHCPDEQALVYACEDIVDDVLGSPSLHETDMRSFVFSVCHRENIEPPTLVNGTNAHALASTDVDTWTICIHRRTTTTSVILHELAHLSVGVDSHGVLFRDELVRLARAHVSIEHASLLHTLFRHMALEMSPWQASARRF